MQRVTMWLFAALFVFVGAARSAPQQPGPHEHPVAKTVPASDATAFRHWLNVASIPINPTPQEVDRQHYFLGAAALGKVDVSTARQILATYRANLDALIAEWNVEARMKGPNFDVAAFEKKREAVVMTAITSLQLTLTQGGSQRLMEHIKTWRTHAHVVEGVE